MKSIFSATARLAMLAFGVCMLVAAPVHAGEIHCELIENSQVSRSIVALMLEAADKGYLYRVDTIRSKIGFQVQHFPFSKVEGSFNQFDGGVTLPEGSDRSRQALFLVKADSMATGDDELDDYLKSSTFFDTTRFPDIIFVSTGFEWLGGNTARVYGDLTLHGVTRSLELNAHIDDATGGDADNSRTVVIHADTDLKRSEFGMHALSILVSDTVTLKIRIAATRVRI